MASLVKQHWKEAAIERTQAITDAWEVFKIIMGRLAEWILFVTMILNIVEMFPGISFWVWAANGIMLIQVVTLDVAGFGLASMADHAQACGHEAEAKHAHWVARLLIGIMIVTLLLVTAGVLFGSNKDLVWLKPWLGYGEDILIFARIIMVVLYGHTIHKLRETTAVHTLSISALDEIARLQRSLDQASQSLADMQAKSNQNEAEWRLKIETMEHTISTLQTPLVDVQTQPDSNEDDNQVNELVNEFPQIVDIRAYQNREDLSTNVETDMSTDASPKIKSVDTKSATSTGRGDARQKALKILKRQPELTPAELAKKAGITRQYASKLIGEQRKSLNA